jgi:hypothetical protein
MNARHIPWCGVFSALLASGFAGSALAQPVGAEPSARAEEGQARIDDAPIAAPALDRGLLKRLEELAGARRTARKEGLKDPKAWQASRAQRASAHRQQLAMLWGSVVSTIDGQARLRMHADRMARLNRMLDLAEQKNDSALSAAIDADIASELARHVQAMQTLKAEAGPP